LPAPPAAADTKDDPRDQRLHVKRRAKSEVGTPYRYGGSSTSGFDCSGFTRWVFSNHGAALPHSSLEQFHLAKRDGNRRVWKRSRLKVGDLVFHKTTSARVGHVGIYIGNGKFVSATSSSGVQVESVWDPYYWGPRWVGATRLATTRA
jgi:cell wall-associated NlpC family hydrolase